MQWLSLIVAFVLLLAALFRFMGGLGPLIAIGEYSDALGLPRLAIWALQVAYIGALFGGIICCIVWFRGLRRAFGSAFDRASTAGDWYVFAGHGILIAAIANIVLRQLRLWDWDLFYVLLMAAAALYSLRLGLLAVMFRSTPVSSSRSSAPAGGTR